MGRVVVIGSSNTDLTVRLPDLPAPGQTVLGGTFAQGPGGKGANQAVAARRAGAEVLFVTAVGNDRLGVEALDRYRAEGIDVSHACSIPEARSGVALIFVDDRGENMIGVASGANLLLTPETIDDLPEDCFRPGDVLLTNLEIPLAAIVTAVARARRAGMRAILNPAPSSPELLDRGILKDIEILTPNRLEASALAGMRAATTAEEWRAMATAILRLGVGAVAMTLGGDGCGILDRDAHRDGLRIPAFPVTVVDTVGAGDAFNGALAAALTRGVSLEDAARWATAAAALAVTASGAQSALPHRDAVDRILAGSRP